MYGLVIIYNNLVNLINYIKTFYVISDNTENNFYIVDDEDLCVKCKGLGDVIKKNKKKYTCRYCGGVGIFLKIKYDDYLEI